MVSDDLWTKATMEIWGYPYFRKPLAVPVRLWHRDAQEPQFAQLSEQRPAK